MVLVRQFDKLSKSTVNTPCSIVYCKPKMVAQCTLGFNYNKYSHNVLVRHSQFYCLLQSKRSDSVKVLSAN